MQYSVPQFIDVKEKIIGPLSIGQFLYIAAGAGISFVLFNVFDFMLFLIFAVPIMAISAALGLCKYNGQSLPKVALSAFGMYRKPRVRVWKRVIEGQEKAAFSKDEKKVTNKKRKELPDKSGLEKLAYVLDTEGGIPASSVKVDEKQADQKVMKPEERQKKVQELLGK